MMHYDTTTRGATEPVPEYVAKDDYAGKWQVTKAGAHKSGTAAAADLAQFVGADGFLILWTFSGITRSGRALYTRSRLLPDAEGRLHGYDSQGVKKVIHPASRRLRYLTTGELT